MIIMTTLMMIIFQSKEDLIEKEVEENQLKDKGYIIMMNTFHIKMLLE